MVSKRWWGFIEKSSPRHYLHLTNDTRRFDPALCVTKTLVGPVDELCAAAVVERTIDPDFTNHWQTRGAAAWRAAHHWLRQQATLTEPGIAQIIAERLPAQAGLFLGNSMPIRDMDQFGYWQREQSITVGANRGASGIDGQIATAIGFARGLSLPTMAVLGDLSTLHDLNSLHLLANCHPEVAVIVINNDGGGIFHFLPIAEKTLHFEQLFATPHGHSFHHAAQMFGVEYRRIETIAQLQDTCDNFWSSPKPLLVEIITDRKTNRQIHADLEGFLKGVS